MKQFILFPLLITISIASFCQTTPRQITYKLLNSVDPDIQLFMQNRMNMYVKDYKPLNKNTVLIKYGQKAFIGKEQNLFFKYSLFDNAKKEAVIKSLDIYGAPDYVLVFFAKFWNTNLNNDARSAFFLFHQDKATFSYNQSTGKPHIVVSNTTIKSPDEYLLKVKQDSTYNTQ